MIREVDFSGSTVGSGMFERFNGMDEALPIGFDKPMTADVAMLDIDQPSGRASVPLAWSREAAD